MEVTIKIACDSSAFQPNAGTEVARILRALAEKVEGQTMLETDSIDLIDGFGNDVGKLTAEGRKLFDNAHGVEHQAAAGTVQEMLAKLHQGVILSVHGFVRIWAEPGQLSVQAHEDEDVEPDYYPLNVAGLTRALEAVGYEQDVEDTDE